MIFGLLNVSLLVKGRFPLQAAECTLVLMSSERK